MIFKSLTIVTLSWTLVAAIIIGFASCDSSSSSDVSSSKQQQRTARKYLELDDLNSGHESSQPVHVFASAEEFDGVEARVVESYPGRPKKFVKRSAQITENARPTGQQQLQQQRTRNARQNQQKKQRPGFFWTLARVTYEVCAIGYLWLRK